MLPAVAMILIAGGVRYIIETGNVMDTILYKIIGLCDGKSPAVIILIIYATIFIFEIFIPSGSAKAFLLMPMIGNLCTAVGINLQVAVLAMAFEMVFKCNFTYQRRSIANFRNDYSKLSKMV